MKTTLFLSVSIDGLISDKQGIPNFPENAWPDWCAFVNDIGNVIAGRSSFEQLSGDETAAMLHPEHKVVLSTKDIDTADTGWQAAKSPAEALEILKSKGVEEAIVGGGRAVAHAFVRENLIDDIVIDLQPTAFGTGTPVFGDELDMLNLELIHSKPINGGALRIRYRVIRD